MRSPEAATFDLSPPPGSGTLFVAMDSALGSVVALVPAFKRSVVPPLEDGIAECLAVYWTIATANDSIDSTSASQVAQRIISLTIGQPWSFWNGREAAFHTRFKAMCQAMMVGKQAAFALGAGRASAEDLRTLFIMNVAKAALASSDKDDTDVASVVSMMERLGEFHEKVWPIVRTAGQPRPMTPVVAQQGTGCLLLLASGIGVALAAVGIAVRVSS